jgi:hypothetical protein
MPRAQNYVGTPTGIWSPTLTLNIIHPGRIV